MSAIETSKEEKELKNATMHDGIAAVVFREWPNETCAMTAPPQKTKLGKQIMRAYLVTRCSEKGKAPP